MAIGCDSMEPPRRIPFPGNPQRSEVAVPAPASKWHSGCSDPTRKGGPCGNWKPHCNGLGSSSSRRQRVSASTQNQALCAILFLCRDVLGIEPEGLTLAARAKRGTHLPVVLSVLETA